MLAQTEKEENENINDVNCSTIEIPKTNDYIKKLLEQTYRQVKVKTDKEVK